MTEALALLGDADQGAQIELQTDGCQHLERQSSRAAWWQVLGDVMLWIHIDGTRNSVMSVLGQYPGGAWDAFFFLAGCASKHKAQRYNTMPGP
jgi:hypothetical protein